MPANGHANTDSASARVARMHCLSIDRSGIGHCAYKSGPGLSDTIGNESKGWAFGLPACLRPALVS